MKQKKEKKNQWLYLVAKGANCRSSSYRQFTQPLLENTIIKLVAILTTHTYIIFKSSFAPSLFNRPSSMLLYIRLLFFEYWNRSCVAPTEKYQLRRCRASAKKSLFRYLDIRFGIAMLAIVRVFFDTLIFVVQAVQMLLFGLRHQLQLFLRFKLQFGYIRRT